MGRWSWLGGGGVWITGYVLIVIVVTTGEAVRPGVGMRQQTMCSVQQDMTDLDCPCRFRDVPCRVPGSVCSTGFIPGGLENELRCQCQVFFERDLDRNCVERASVVLGLPPPPPFQEVGVINEQIEGPNDYDFNPVNRAAPKKHAGPKRPLKKPPFRTVMITSNPLYALQPSRRPQSNPFHKPKFQNGMGIGVEGPSLDSILTQSRPRDWTRPTFPVAKGPNGKGTGFHKGTHFSKRPSTRFPRRTTRAIPRADGSRVVNGWYPDIWPAVGLNYSI